MAMRYGLFDSTEVVEEVGGFPVGNKAQTADFFARYFASFISNGICGKGGDGFKIVPGNGLQVKVLPGEAYINGYFCFDDEAQVIDFPFSELAQSYRLILRLDTGMGEIALHRVDVAHEAVRTEERYELIIGQVYLPGGCVAVTADMIDDMRGEENMCGFMQTLAYGGADRLAAPITLSLTKGCEGSITTDLSENVSIEVRKVNMSCASGVLPIAKGGTGGASAAAARANLGAAAAVHATLPEEVLDGVLGAGVITTNRVDMAARPRNIAICQSLPSSLPDGAFCAVYGEQGRGLYVFVSGAAVKIASPGA